MSMCVPARVLMLMEISMMPSSDAGVEKRLFLLVLTSSLRA